VRRHSLRSNQASHRLLVVLIAQAPLRVSLLGGGSDLPAFLEQAPGSVLSFAIDRRVFLAGHPFTHRSGILLKYSKTEDVESPSDLVHPIARVVLERYGINDIDLAVMADVPAGTGLGSSSSFTVVMLTFAHHLVNKKVTAAETAAEAVEIEVDVLGEPIGYQDQWASAVGGINALHFEGRAVHVEPLQVTKDQVSQLQSHLFLVPVGSPRSASDLLKIQRDSLNESSETFRATCEIRDLVPLGVSAIAKDISALGPLLHQSWEIKRRLGAGISNSAVDEAYERGMNAGATGGKLLGAGGSGYLLFFVPEGKQSQFKASVPKPLDFTIARQGAGIIHES